MTRVGTKIYSSKAELLPSFPLLLTLEAKTRSGKASMLFINSKMAYLRKPYHRISLWVRESESLKAEKVCKWEGVFQEQDPDYTKFPEKLWKILVCYFENRTCLWSPNTPIQTFKHTFQCAPSLMQDSK